MRKIFESGLRKKYYELIKSGIKTVECRLNDSKRQQIDVGDYYIFSLEPERQEKIKTKVVNKKIYKNFLELCEDILPADAGFESKDEMIKTYSELYSVTDQNKNGVVAFFIKLEN